MKTIGHYTMGLKKALKAAGGLTCEPYGNGFLMGNNVLCCQLTPWEYEILVQPWAGPPGNWRIAPNPQPSDGRLTRVFNDIVLNTNPADPNHPRQAPFVFNTGRTKQSCLRPWYCPGKDLVFFLDEAYLQGFVNPCTHAPKDHITPVAVMSNGRTVAVVMPCLANDRCKAAVKAYFRFQPTPPV